jgi:hypothetical protein
MIPAMPQIAQNNFSCAKIARPSAHCCVTTLTQPVPEALDRAFEKWAEKQLRGIEAFPRYSEENHGLG